MDDFVVLQRFDFRINVGQSLAQRSLLANNQHQLTPNTTANISLRLKLIHLLNQRIQIHRLISHIDFRHHFGAIRTVFIAIGSVWMHDFSRLTIRGFELGTRRKRSGLAIAVIKLLLHFLLGCLRL